LNETHTARADGIEQIRLPMTDHTLRYINAYLIEGDDGYTLVDCGWGLPEVFETLESALRDLGKRLDQIRWVIATHFHTDHYGMAGTLAERGGSKLMMHPLDWAVIDARFRKIDEEFVRRDAWLARNGFAMAGYASEDRVRKQARRFSLKEPDRRIEDGDVLTIGKRHLRVVWTPGHTPGHICLYDEERSVVFTGDHVLPQITPHIGYWVENDPDPLGKFLESLHKVKALGAKSALPAHREPIEDLGGRIDEILAHHEEREAQVLNALNGRLTGAEVAAKLSWRRNQSKFDELPATERSFALVETLAHLEHLRSSGGVEKISGPDVIRYQKRP
jgi:glyoxylase-like metal-dependent hydrolase (beta-lactamase superfamily II)